MISWLESCKQFPKELARIDDAIRTADYLTHHASELDDNQIDLIVLGLLVAQQSTGAEHVTQGYFQADVLTRRIIITAGGFIGGKSVADVMSTN